MNKKILLLTVSAFLSIVFYLLWIGPLASYDLSTPHQMKTGCYEYHSDIDLKNIAAFLIVKSYGQDALSKQRILYLTHHDDDHMIYVGGSPYGLIRSFVLYFSNMEYVTPLIVTLTKDDKVSCAYFVSALYEKN